MIFHIIQDANSMSGDLSLFLDSLNYILSLNIIIESNDFSTFYISNLSATLQGASVGAVIKIKSTIDILGNNMATNLDFDDMKKLISG